MSDLEDYDCPLCMEELDISERNFKPCPCGYQICRFCWHHIKEELNGKCPACRRSYSDENVQFTPITSTEFSRIKTEKKCKEREKKEIESTSRKHLTNVRVVQKNLIYVIGLTARVTEEVLRSSDYFGQYGKITKIVINRRHAQNSTSTHPGQTPTIGVYVTYARREDAAKAIAAVDGSMSDGRILRATYGTTKYCTYYLRNMPCQNPNCMYLHEPGEEADTFTREDLASGKHNIKDHHAQLEHLSPKPQTLGTHSTSLLLSPSEQGDSPPHKLETPVVVYRSESKSSDGDTEGSALPATASWAKVSTKKSALSTTKSPPLGLNQFPPPPAAGRPKAKVISLSKNGKSELKSRTSSEEEDENDKKRIEITKMVSAVANTESKIATSHATLALSNSLEDNHQGAEKHQSNGNGQIVAQKETSQISNSVSNLFEEADKEANLKEQAQKISSTVPQAGHNLVNEERLHQEVMAELERERTAFYQQQSRTNSSLHSSLLDVFNFSSMPTSASVYKGDFDPFGSVNPNERGNSETLLSSLQNMHIRGNQSGPDSHSVFNTYDAEEFSQISQSQNRKYGGNDVQPVHNSRPKLYSRFGFALNEEDDFESTQSRIPSVNTRSLQPSGLFDPFQRSSPNYTPDQNNLRGMYPVGNSLGLQSEEISQRAGLRRVDRMGLPMVSQEWRGDLPHAENNQHPLPFTTQTPMSFSNRLPARNMPPGMAPPPGYSSGYNERMGNLMNGHHFEDRSDVNFHPYTENASGHQLSPTHLSYRNPNQPLWQEPQSRASMDMFDHNLRRFPDSQPPGLGQFDSQLASEQSHFFGNLHRPIAEKRNTTSSIRENGYFRDSAIRTSHATSPPNSVDYSDMMPSRNWNGNMNNSFQNNPLHRLRGYDVDFKLDSGELGQFKVS